LGLGCCVGLGKQGKVYLAKYPTFVCSRDKEREGEFDVKINTKAFFLLIRTFITIYYALAKCGFIKHPC
jgi:hypothetical protein